MGSGDRDLFPRGPALTHSPAQRLVQRDGPGTQVTATAAVVAVVVASAVVAVVVVAAGHPQFSVSCKCCLESSGLAWPPLGCR